MLGSLCAEYIYVFHVVPFVHCSILYGLLQGGIGEPDLGVRTFPATEGCQGSQWHVERVAWQLCTGSRHKWVRCMCLVFRIVFEVVSSLGKHRV